MDAKVNYYNETNCSAIYIVDDIHATLYCASFSCSCVQKVRRPWLYVLVHTLLRYYLRCLRFCLASRKQNLHIKQQRMLKNAQVGVRQHAESPPCARHYKWHGKERVSNTGLFFLRYSTCTSKWMHYLKLGFITWEVRLSQPRPAKAPQLFYTELAKAMERTRMHSTLSTYIFFSHIGFDTHAMFTAR